MSSLPARLTLSIIVGVTALASACAVHAPTPSVGTPRSATAAVPATPQGSPQDFDFEHGRWHTTLRRRLHPLSGSEVWADYAGTTVVRPLLGGRANVADLDVSGPAGRIQGLSLRLFDTAQKKWTLNFSNAASGTLATPMAGGFDGSPRGVFYSAEEFGGRRVLVRFVIESRGVDSSRFEQAFSPDGGATWETNWIAEDVRSGAQ